MYSDLLLRYLCLPLKLTIAPGRIPLNEYLSNEMRPTRHDQIANTQYSLMKAICCLKKPKNRHPEEDDSMQKLMRKH